jgi:hypothetical protein
VVAVTPAPVLPATPAPVAAVTPAPVLPATPAPVAAVTPAPAVPATPAPVTVAPSAGLPESPGFPACDVCGAGKSVTNPDAVVTLPDQDPTSCAQVQLGGQLGFIEAIYCPIVVSFLVPCGCA